MLNSKGFDKWSGTYDESIRNSNGYPFEGYYEILNYVQMRIDVTDETKILDIGVGTGELTYELYKKGLKIFGLDFSSRMIDIAQTKMPKAEFYCMDFKPDVTKMLKRKKFDYIVSSYALHHIENQHKIELIHKLMNNLKDGGKLIVADVAFETKETLEKCREIFKKKWDFDEFYLAGKDTISELSKIGLKASYKQLSICAGILEVVKTKVSI